MKTKYEVIAKIDNDFMIDKSTYQFMDATKIVIPWDEL